MMRARAKKDEREKKAKPGPGASNAGQAQTWQPVAPGHWTAAALGQHADHGNAPGQPLDAGTRSFMEPRFGHDFSIKIGTKNRD